MEKIYLYTFIDNDYIDSVYHIITNKQCDDLIKDIERYYYHFENYETIEELINYLRKNNANIELTNYISKQEEIIDLVDSGICNFTYAILDYLDILICFEEKVFKY